MSFTVSGSKTTWEILIDEGYSDGRWFNFKQFSEANHPLQLMSLGKQNSAMLLNSLGENIGNQLFCKYLPEAEQGRSKDGYVKAANRNFFEVKI